MEEEDERKKRTDLVRGKRRIEEAPVYSPRDPTGESPPYGSLVVAGSMAAFPSPHSQLWFRSMATSRISRQPNSGFGSFPEPGSSLRMGPDDSTNNRLPSGVWSLSRWRVKPTRKRDELFCDRRLRGRRQKPPHAACGAQESGPATARAMPGLKSRAPSCVLVDKNIYPATDPNRPSRDGSGFARAEDDRRFSG